ncbi:uncharacterized protein LOC133039890 [Cannabis sativa]|uniref:uncharacterized protein LOC133039890 n=1 Tax=Cannabis sativa TaxID=3483 RepID=UPI0029CA0D51|nr:uncharacterized protein LOC133039890 [Cannabis sativa]
MAFSLLVLENSSGMHPSVAPPFMVDLVHPNWYCDGCVPLIHFFSSKPSLLPFFSLINPCIYCSEGYNEYPSHLNILFQSIKCANPSLFLLIRSPLFSFSLSLSSSSPPNFIITIFKHFGFWKMEAELGFNDDLKLQIIIFPTRSRIWDKMARSFRRSQRAFWFYLFKGRSRFALHPKDMFAWCQSFLLQYLDAKQTRFIPTFQGDQSPLDLDRCPPGRYKVFTDAAIDTGKQVFSLSVVVKNDSDQVVAGLVKPVTGIIPPVIAEAKAVSLAVAWTKMINLPVHVLFSDCKIVVDKINKCNWNNSVCDDVLIDVYNSLSFNPRPKVVFIRRDENTHAHNLAKLGLGLDRKLLWNGSLPSL